MSGFFHLISSNIKNFCIKIWIVAILLLYLCIVKKEIIKTIRKMKNSELTKSANTALALRITTNDFIKFAIKEGKTAEEIKEALSTEIIQKRIMNQVLGMI